MKIVCEACEAKYSVADSKVQGKNFKITCKKCGNKIVIRNKKEEEEVDTSSDFGGFDSNFDNDSNLDSTESDTLWNADPSDMEFDEQATQIFNYADAQLGNNSPKVEEKDDADWYIHIEGEQVGPITLDELKSKITTHNLPGSTNVWQTGMADWVMASDITELSDVIVDDPVIPEADPFTGGGIDEQAAGFGSESLFDESDAESLMGIDSNLESSDNDSAFSDSFGSSNPNQGFDLASLIGDGDFDDDEEEDDDSSKSKVIDFRDIVGNNPNKRIVVQQATFNAGGSKSEGGNKKIMMIAGAVALIAILGGIAMLFLGGDKEYSTLITSPTPGAIVKINGEIKPSGIPLKLKNGTYIVTVSKPNYKEETRTIVIKDNAPTPLNIELKANPVLLTLKTGLAGADISINGKLLGQTDDNGNAKVNVTPSDNVVVKISKDGALTEKTLAVSPEGMKEFTIVANKPEEKIAVANKKPEEKVIVEEKPEEKIVKKTNRRTNKRTNRRTRKVVKATHTKKKKSGGDDDLDDLFGPKKVTKKVASNLPKTLKRDQVFGTIKRTYPKVKACGKKAGVTGKVPVKFKINGTGSVSNIKVSSAAGGAKNCIYSKVRGMRFPKFSGKAIPVTFPFKL